MFPEDELERLLRLVDRRYMTAHSHAAFRRRGSFLRFRPVEELARRVDVVQPVVLLRRAEFPVPNLGQRISTGRSQRGVLKRRISESATRLPLVPWLIRTSKEHRAKLTTGSTGHLSSNSSTSGTSSI